MRNGILQLACLLLTCYALRSWSDAADKPVLLVIAHPQTPVERLTLEQLSSIYLAKMKTWPDGSKIVPVNREASSSVRALFSKAVFNEPPEALTDYWTKLQFKGEKPPLIQESDNGAVLFVQRVPGAIAYVTQGTPLVGVKVLLTLVDK